MIPISSLMVFFKIYNYYPDNLVYVASRDEDTLKWNSSVFSSDEKEPLKEMLYCFDTWSFQTEEDANDYMAKFIDYQMENLKITLN